MITRQFLNAINELKHEVGMLQSLTELVHTTLEHSDALEVIHCVTVSQDIAYRLWQVCQHIESIETTLETTVEGTV